MVARATPFALVAVSKISAGTIQAVELVSLHLVGREGPRHTKRSHAGETKVKQPCHDDESPVSSGIILRCRKLGHQDSTDDIRHAHGKVSNDDHDPTTNLVDKGHDDNLTNESNDRVDGLISKGVRAVDADLLLECA